jgi:hypothetical protein
MSKKDEKVIGAWAPRADSRTSRTGYQVVYTTKFGTAHAGATRKVYRIPDGIAALDGSAPAVHPLLRCGDKELAEAFERLVADPSFSKIKLTP